jgi:AhpD family alkylhydroperoxidase
MERISLNETPQGMREVLLNVEQYIAKSGMDKNLLNLVKMRASQINSCAYCLDMHSKEAIHAGETEQRLFSLPAWRETPYYSEKERAALLRKS